MNFARLRSPLARLTPSPQRTFCTSMTSRAQTPTWTEWRTNVPSATPLDSTTFKNQSQLPKLPVPELNVTLDKLIQSATPLAKDSAELDALKRKVEEFRTQQGLGPVLQQRLQERKESTRNWIAEWWDNDAYMAYRDSIVCNVSYYYGFKRFPQAAPGTSSPPAADPAYVAASIATTALEFRDLLVKGLIEPEPAGKEGELCMESYKWAFNACRVPASPADFAVKVAEDSKEGQHIVIINKNNFYSIPIYNEKGRQHTVEEFRRTVQEIIDRGDKEAPAVGILTGINRDHWTQAFTHLNSDSTNAKTIKAIETSVFVICLDQAKPEPELKEIPNSRGSKTSPGMVDFSEKIWKAGTQQTGAGEGGNRWWDKPCQWLVFANGEAGFIGEHSCMDGTPTARLNDFVSRRLLTNEPKPVGASDPPAKQHSKPVSLPFKVDEKTLSAIDSGTKEFAELVGNHRAFYLHYGRYGKNGIKKMKTSPDGWAQMVFQLAYYMTHGKPCGTYEAAQVRRFQLGRTETVRIATSASLAFTQAMADSNKSNDEKRALFQKAIEGHGKDMKAASAGLGIDRHLFGLKHLVQPNETAPELFSDDLLKRSSTWTMSTSQIFIANAPAYGWGRVDPNGYGIPYMIHNDHLQFTITCEAHMDGQKFIDNIGKAADLIMDMMQSASDPKL